MTYGFASSRLAPKRECAHPYNAFELLVEGASREVVGDKAALLAAVEGLPPDVEGYLVVDRPLGDQDERQPSFKARVGEQDRDAWAAHARAEVDASTASGQRRHGLGVGRGA